MNKRYISGWVSAGTFLSLVICTLFSVQVLAAKKLPEVSKDGLHLLSHTKVAAAYAKPGADFSGYTQVKILDCYVAFEKNWEKNYNLNEVGLTGRIRDKDVEEIKKRLASEFEAVFSKELTKKGFQVVDSTDPGVLLLRPALINVDVAAPDLNTPSMSRTLIQSAGGMTLFLELYDAATSTLLARVIDAQGDDSGFTREANRVTNKAAADRILRAWADQLAKHVGNVTKKK